MPIDEIRSLVRGDTNQGTQSDSRLVFEQQRMPWFVGTRTKAYEATVDWFLENEECLVRGDTNHGKAQGHSPD